MRRETLACFMILIFYKKIVIAIVISLSAREVAKFKYSSQDLAISKRKFEIGLPTYLPKITKILEICEKFDYFLRNLVRKR